MRLCKRVLAPVDSLLPNCSFGTFPDRIQHVLTESHSDLTVESCVYPAYDTRGELVTAGGSRCCSFHLVLANPC